MNYEEKYKKALKSMRDLYNKMKYLSSTDALATTVMLENTFPELRESEDERIRYSLMSFLNSLSETEVPSQEEFKKWWMWLEKQGENKSSWSEEDEKRISRITDFIWKNRKGDTDEIYQQEQDVNWLKSLKPKEHWKPSEEQMQALFEAKLASTKNREYFLGLLYEDLKKLKLC